MTRSKSIASQEIVLYVPEQAYREYSGNFSGKRGGEVDELSNSPVESPLAKAVVKELANQLGLDGDFAIQGDGTLVEVS